MSNFQGFERPKSNYTKVPNVFWELEGLDIYERMVLLYILHHTWGFQEFDLHKTITTDEFQNGRKRSDGSRMDKGCGISRGKISQSLNALEDKGYISVKVNDNDKARIKKSYMIVMQNRVHDMNAEFTERTQGSSSEYRTEKETKKETLERTSLTVLPPKQNIDEPTTQDLQSLIINWHSHSDYGGSIDNILNSKKYLDTAMKLYEDYQVTLEEVKGCTEYKTNQTRKGSYLFWYLLQDMEDYRAKIAADKAKELQAQAKAQVEQQASERHQSMMAEINNWKEA